MRLDPTRRSILDTLRGKDVLVVGPLGNYRGFRELLDMWDFHYLTTICKSVLGLDLDADAVSMARADGFAVEIGNAEDFRRQERYDAIVATDVIEHIGNPQLFINNAKQHLAPTGKLIIETPNPWAVEVAVRSLTRGPIGNPDHTCWMDANNIGLLMRRAGMRVDSVMHYTALNEFGLAMRLRTRVYRAFGRMRSHLHSKVVVIASISEG